MKRIVLACVCTLGLTNIISAQQYSNVIIANGGKFESAIPYVDRATIGAYDQVQDKYWVFDTIQEESVQDLAIEGNFAYLAASNKIIKYDLTTYKRVAETDYAGIRSVSLHDTLLFVGKFYGSGAFLSVYDSRDLSLMFDVAEIDQPVASVVVVGDTAYAPYNQKGTVDQWPPYMVFNDTIGKIGVIDLVNQNYVRTLNLDTIGAGANDVFAYKNTVVAVCETNGVVAKYDVNSMEIDYDTVGISKAIAMEDSLLMAHYVGVVGTYDFVQGSSTTTSLGFSVSGWSLGSSAYDSLNNQIILTETDFGSYGKALIYDDAGQAIDTFNVNISPQAMAVNYKTGNASPIALNDYAEAMEDTSGINVDVLSSDFDPNGDNLTLSILSNGVGGTASLVNDSIHYIPNASFFGLDSIEYKICDGSACDSAYLVINVVHISSVGGVKSLSKLELYPNPATSQVNVISGLIGQKQIVVYDVKGQIIYSEGFNGIQSSISVDGFAKGAYIVKITNGNTVELGKLLVE